MDKRWEESEETKLQLSLLLCVAAPPFFFGARELESVLLPKPRDPSIQSHLSPKTMQRLFSKAPPQATLMTGTGRKDYKLSPERSASHKKSKLFSSAQNKDLGVFAFPSISFFPGSDFCQIEETGKS